MAFILIKESERSVNKEKLDKQDSDPVEFVDPNTIVYPKQMTAFHQAYGLAKKTLPGKK